MTEVGWTENVQEVKKGIRDHFAARFKQYNFQRPYLNGVEFKQLSLEDSLSLEIPFDKKEVKDTVWQCANDKSPGPYGFDMNFFKACQDTLKVDVSNFISHFFCSSKLLR